MNKCLSKQSRCRWFETPWRSLWRQKWITQFLYRNHELVTNVKIFAQILMIGEFYGLCQSVIEFVNWTQLINNNWNTSRVGLCKDARIHSPVREITKSSSTFSSTNTSSNIIWSISTAWYNPNEIKWNLILVPNLVAFISQKEKNVCFFDYHSLTCSVRTMVLICLMQNIDMYLLYKSHQIARLVSHLINHFSKWMFTV